RHGPRLLQPYYDIAKLFRKETVLPDGAGPVFRAAPYVAFACYLTVPLLIPELVAFPPQLAYMGDILGGGFLLSLASYAVSLAAIDSGSPYAQLGSSRVRSFGALAEPTILFVVFVVALTTQTDLPFAMVKTLEGSIVEVLRPSHLLVLAAFFMVVLAETGRVPLENHGSTLEFGMIEEARTLEHSGPGFALLKWGSSMKQLILFVLLANVFAVPWGLAHDSRLDHVLIAIGLLLAKALGIGVVIAAIESAFAKLRLYKIPEFTVGSFLLAVLGVISFVFEHEFGHGGLTVFGAVSSVAAVAVLLVAFALLRSQDVWEQLRLYALSSALVAVLAFAAAGTAHGAGLYALGAVTIAFKALAVPLFIGLVIRTLEVPVRVPSSIGFPSAVLVGIALASFSFLALARLPLHTTSKLPLSALAVSVAVVLVSFLLMIVRPYAPSQLIGFLMLENGVSLASLVLAPSLPMILALLLLFDVVVGVLVFVLLVQYLGVHRTSVGTETLRGLRG
ncbi:MAG: NADH-quinone oxidoreductase subunit H, partial [Gaiellaceae bacterium]